MKVLISSTERKRDLFSVLQGISSVLPERYGSDVLAFTKRGRVGFQRKQFPDDFFASEKDNRLTRELSQMQVLEHRWLILEGLPVYTSEGSLMSEYYSHWDKRSIRNLLRSIQIRHEIQVEWAEDLEDTADMVREVILWVEKSKHVSLVTRNKEDVTDDWGFFSGRDFARYFLQGFPRLGPRRAEQIYDYFERIPMKWDCTLEELQDSVGKKTGESLFGYLKETKKD
jgi:ERCC4-type nuclease